MSDVMNKTNLEQLYIRVNYAIESLLGRMELFKLINPIIDKKDDLVVIAKGLDFCSKLLPLIKNLILESDEERYEHFLNSVDIPRKQELEQILKAINLEDDPLKIHSNLIDYIFKNIEDYVLKTNQNPSANL